MKLAFTAATPETSDPTMMALRGDLRDSFRLLADLGYRGVDLMVRDPKQLGAAAIEALASRAGIEVISISTGQLRKEDGLTLLHPDPEVGRLAASRLREVLDFASHWSIPVNLGMLRGDLADGADRDRSLERAREILDLLLDYASRKGISIALEPQNRRIVNWLNTVEETVSWLEGFSRDNLGILFDVYHASIEESSVTASLRRAFPYLAQVQISDSDRKAPGDGELDLPEVVRTLRALGYQGYLTVEIFPRPSAAEAATRSARYLSPLLREEP